MKYSLLQKIQFFFLSVLIVFLGYQTPAYAIHLELTQGMKMAIPIAIVPFGNSTQADLLYKVVSQDLGNSGQFRLVAGNGDTPHLVSEVAVDQWKATGAEDVVVAAIRPVGADRWQVQMGLRQVVGDAPTLINKSFTATTGQLRALGHHISDLVYQQLTGQKGVFSTKISYVLVNGEASHPLFHIVVADFDGYNPQTVVTSYQPLMSPAWSPDGKNLVYVSFENQRSQIFIVNTVNGQRRLVSDYPRLNASPAWSPDGRKLALVLSKSGSANLYMLDLASNSLQPLTKSSAINTEPVWHPDGRTLFFTSDQTGSPQIYQLNLASHAVSRVTFEGSYNASPSVTPDGKTMVLLHREGGADNIAKIDLTDSRYPMSILTRSGRNESPSIAPNGYLVLYSSILGGQRVLEVVSVDGNVKMRIPANEGELQEPTWGPFRG